MGAGRRPVAVGAVTGAARRAAAPAGPSAGRAIWTTWPVPASSARPGTISGTAVERTPKPL